MRTRRLAIALFTVVLGASSLACQSTTTQAPAGSSAQASARATVAPADAARGKNVYLADCLGCHAPEANVARSFSSTEFQAKYQNAEALKKVTRNGLHPMPQFTPQQLSEQNIVDLAAYIQSLK